MDPVKPYTLNLQLLNRRKQLKLANILSYEPNPSAELSQQSKYNFLTSNKIEFYPKSSNTSTNVKNK